VTAGFTKQQHMKTLFSRVVVDHNEIRPVGSKAVLERLTQIGDMAFLARRLVDFFRACDGRLEGRDYLADEISIADLALYPFFVGRKALLEQAGGLDRLGALGRAPGRTVRRRSRHGGTIEMAAATFEVGGVRLPRPCAPGARGVILLSSRR
jgi:glutathione S-transferase